MFSTTFGPFTQAGGRRELLLVYDSSLPWHEICVAIFDGQSPATSVTGTMEGEARKYGADQYENFSQALDLAAGDRAWAPEMSRVRSFAVTPTGLNPAYEYYVTVNSWGG